MSISKKYIDQKANNAATSPKNNLPMPTEEQKKNGDYKKGHLNIHGLSISIENPKGSIRSGVDRSGKKWSVKLKNHYGYINGNNIGKDGDPIDVFLGENPKSEKVFIVNQINKNGDSDTFDEHKVLIGFYGMSDAIKGYLQNYEKDWDKRGMINSVVQTDIEGFKDWLKNGSMKKPFRGSLK